MRRGIPMWGWWYRGAVFALIVGPLLSGPSTAEEVAFDPNRWPFTAIAKLNVVTGPGSRQHCTATLVDRRQALTAAHCLYDKARKIWVEPTAIHFVAGYAQGHYSAHTTAMSYHKPDAFDYSKGTSASNSAHDWALIELATEIGIKPVRVRPEAEHAVSAATLSQIVRAGYRRDRHQLLTAQQNCSAKLLREPAHLLLHDCRAVPGESGSALLYWGGGEPEIIGVLVAAPNQEGAAPSVAVPASTFSSAVANAISR